MFSKYTSHETKYMMEYCSNCLKYNFDNNVHCCQDDYSAKPKRRKINSETIILCNEFEGFKNKIDIE